MISKFPDDTKITGRVTTTPKVNQLQSNFSILVSWSEKWQMNFIVDKCNVLHIRNNNHLTKYSMNCSELSKVWHEKDLRVTIIRDFKRSKHFSNVIKKTNKLVGFIGRTFEYKSEKKLS